MPFVESNRDAPFEGGSGNGQILQPGQQEVLQHLVAPGDGLNEIRVILDVFDEPVRIFGEAEEIALLLGLLHGPPAIRAFAVHQLAIQPEGFAGRADKIVVGDIHEPPEILNARHNAIDILFGLHPLLPRDFLYLLAMLIRPGQEHDIIARLPLEARHGVCGHCAIGVADMQLVAGVVDRRCDVKRFLTHGFSFWRTAPIFETTGKAGYRFLPNLSGLSLPKISVP